MLPRIARFIAAHRMFAANSDVGVAVSGGADSVFLLHALRELAAELNIRLSVVHIDHGIRGAASQADAGFVRDLAAAWELPFHLHTAQVLTVDDNLEQAARNIRRSFFAELMAAGLVDCVATGHTRSDQAETVLFRTLRGTGLAGLAGILPVTAEGVVRPLLQCSRPEIEAWLRERGIAWREDATNLDPRFARNRLRAEILPLLTDALNPCLEKTLAKTAALARDEESYWRVEVERYIESRPGTQILTTRLLTEVHPALARRIIRRAIELVKGDLRQIEFGHVERVIEMAGSNQGNDRVQIPGVDIMRSFEWVRFAEPVSYPAVERDFSAAVELPGSTELPDGSARITLQVLEKTAADAPYARVVDELDWTRFAVTSNVPSGFELRNWRPGDRYQPLGQSNAQKIKFLFQEARIPLWERRNWPIITYNGEIIWVRRFGAAAEFAADASTRAILRVSETVFSESGNRTAEGARLNG